MLIGALRLIPSISDANLNLGCVFRSKLDVQPGRFVVSNDFAYVLRLLQSSLTNISGLLG